ATSTARTPSTPKSHSPPCPPSARPPSSTSISTRRNGRTESTRRSSFPRSASRVRGRIESALNYAKVQNWRDGENPAAWSGNLEHALPAPSRIGQTKHYAALPWSELPSFMAALRERDGDRLVRWNWRF